MFFYSLFTNYNETQGLPGSGSPCVCIFILSNQIHGCYQQLIHRRIVVRTVTILLENQPFQGLGNSTPESLQLSGIADPVFYEDTLAYMGALSQFETDGEACDILLAHRPEFARTYRQAGFELTLSGHAHGGQVRIPWLLNGLYAPNQGWFPGYAGGIYDLDGGHLVVSRGLMIDDLPRIFNPPEIVVIEIRPE